MSLAFSRCAKTAITASLATAFLCASLTTAEARSNFTESAGSARAYSISLLATSNYPLEEPQAVNDATDITGTIGLTGGGCAYYSNGQFSGIEGGTPCWFGSMNMAGVAAGFAEVLEGPNEGYAYGGGFNNKYPSTSYLTAVNDNDVTTGYQARGVTLEPGIFNLTTNTWTNIADPKTGCTQIYP